MGLPMCSCPHHQPEVTECPGDCGCWDIWSTPDLLPGGYWELKEHPALMINRDGIVRVQKTGNLIMVFKKNPKDHDRERMIRIKQGDEIFEHKVEDLIRTNVPPF